MDEPLEFEELWALEIDDKPGQLVCPIDGNSHEDQGALVYFSREAAESAAEYQSRYYEVDCTPRRIVTTPIDAPHEWTIYRPASNNIEWCWCMRCDTNKRGYWWYRDPMSRDSVRFPTATEAQTYIDTEKIEDAYPWPVPKLTS